MSFLRRGPSRSADGSRLVENFRHAGAQSIGPHSRNAQLDAAAKFRGHTARCSRFY